MATNVIGKRLLQRAENILLRVPVFRTIYAPVRQLVIAFSPDNESGFKRVVLHRGRHARVHHGLPDEGVHGGARRGASESLVAVYVPTNHLYLGDIVICERERAIYPDIAVEEGIRIFLTGGMAFPPTLRGMERPRSQQTGRRLPGIIRIFCEVR